MPDTHLNLIKQTISNTPGTSGALTLSAAVSGWLALGAGNDGQTFNVTIYASDSDTAAKEVRTGCVYTHSGTSLSRGTLEAGTAINLTSSAIVVCTLPASVITQMDALASVFGGEVISVTGAVTATIGAMHYCTGTSADYEVALPAASGNAGKMLGFRMGPVAALSKLVTLNPNASETIDGLTTRIMWADEVAILLCDGSNWFKVAGKSVPMLCVMHRSGSNQTGVVTSTVTKVTLDTITHDAAGMGDTGNARIGIKRPGDYMLSGTVGWDSLSGSSARALSQIQINGSAFVNAETSTSGASYATPFAVKMKRGMAVGDLVTIHGLHQVGTNQSIYGTGTVTHVSALEVPAW